MGTILRMILFDIFQCSRLFGSFKSKDGAPKSPAHTVPSNELHMQVDTEKKKNVKLQEQIEKMRQENYHLAAEGEYWFHQIQVCFVFFFFFFFFFGTTI